MRYDSEKIGGRKKNWLGEKKKLSDKKAYIFKSFCIPLQNIFHRLSGMPEFYHNLPFFPAVFSHTSPLCLILKAC